MLHKGDNRIIIHGGANRAYEFADFSKILIKKARKGDIFIAQLETKLETVVQGLRLAKELGMTTILNPAPAFKEATEALKYCDIVVPNETETQILVDEYPCPENYKSIGNKFKQYGVENLVITCGEKGSVLINDKVTTVDAYNVDVADTTAAGDTYIGAFAARFAKGESLLSALEYATAASALAVTRKGAQRSIPSEAEVLQFLQQRTALAI